MPDPNNKPPSQFTKKSRLALFFGFVSVLAVAGFVQFVTAGASTPDWMRMLAGNLVPFLMMLFFLGIILFQRRKRTGSFFSALVADPARMGTPLPEPLLQIPMQGSASLANMNVIMPIAMGVAGLAMGLAFMLPSYHPHPGSHGPPPAFIFAMIAMVLAFVIPIMLALKAKAFVPAAMQGLTRSFCLVVTQQGLEIPIFALDAESKKILGNAGQFILRLGWEDIVSFSVEPVRRRGAGTIPAAFQITGRSGDRTITYTVPRSAFAGREQQLVDTLRPFLHGTVQLNDTLK